MSVRKAGIVGAGKVSTEHIKAYQAIGVNVVAVCSRTLDGARAKISECNLAAQARAYSDLHLMLKIPDLDIVSVCSPPELHADHVIMVANAGKHIAIEKPAALTEHRLMDMCEAVSTAGVRTVVGFVLRWNDLVQNIKQKYLHILGDIVHLETGYWHGSSHGKQQSEHKYGTRTVSIGAMVGGGCHAMDMARFLAGSDITTVLAVSARSKRTERRSVSANVWFKNGLTGSVSAFDNIYMPYWFQIQLFGEDGSIRNTNQLYSRSNANHEFLTIPGTVPDSGAVWHHPFKEMITELVGSVQMGVETTCSLQDSVNVHKAVFAAEKSALLGGSMEYIL